MPGVRSGASLLRDGLLLALTALLLVFLTEPLWAPLERKTYDLRVNLCRSLLPTQVKAEHVVVIGIGDREILEKKPFVFWYPDLGRLLSRVAQAGPAAVGFDLIPYHSLEKRLGESLPDLEGGGEGGAGLLPEEVGRRLDAALVSGLIETSRQTTFIQGVAGSMVPFYYDLLAFMQTARPAALQVSADEDGLLRRQTFDRSGEVEAFPAALYRAGFGGEGTQLPLAVAIDYALFDQIPRYAFHEVMAEDFPLATLSGKIVLIGLLSTIDDVHQTPLGEQSGVLVHATTIETLINRTAPTATSPYLDWLTGFCFALAVFRVIARRPLLTGGLLVGGVVAGVGVVSLLLFSHGVVVPLTAQAALPVVVFSLCAMYRYTLEARERRHIYQTFSYYVDTKTIDKIMAQGHDKIMEGEEHEACIMFLDIRGFTEMSSRLPAASIVAMLNVFFGRITEVVQQQQGLVNKFIGDGMLAFFIAEQGSVDAALHSSVRICRVIEEMNRRGELAPFIGEERIAIGIGLHAGRIILGNVGSRRKLDFTVIGPPVNMAARIEAMTKRYGRQVLVSRTVTEQASAQFRFEWVGETGLKGIEGEVELFALDLTATGMTEDADD